MAGAFIRAVDIHPVKVGRRRSQTLAMKTGSSEIQAESGPECTALSTGSVDSSERIGVPGSMGFLEVLTQEPYAGWIRVHGPMVTFAQKRTGCGSIKADPAAIGSESTPEDASEVGPMRLTWIPTEAKPHTHVPPCSPSRFSRVKPASQSQLEWVIKAAGDPGLRFSG
jgi:hypothetical protein